MVPITTSYPLLAMLLAVLFRGTGSPWAVAWVVL